MVIRKGVCLKLAGRIVGYDGILCSYLVFGVKPEENQTTKTNRKRHKKRKKKKMDLIMNNHE